MARTIIFDLDGTLIDEQACNEAAYRTVCGIAAERHGIDAAKLHEAVYRQAGRLWHRSRFIEYTETIGISRTEGLYGNFAGDNPNLDALQRWVPQYRHEAWLHALGEQDIVDFDFAAELSRLFAEDRPRRHLVYPDAEPALQLLKKTYRLGLLTNGAPGVQLPKIDGSGLGHYFDVTIISGEIGIGKPDPRIFKHTIDRLDVTADETVMVGDSLERDIIGAQQAEIRPIWISRVETQLPDGAIPVDKITSLAELADLL